ncbi:NRDE family protein [Flavobacterium sp. F-65]|uniref:NRDE family protein n=1 Tax=Flavobacterium pisciphilum TaxID=2893755 RepID=A0ABS8MVF8_9FLAO|nr:NRDE family protein [Flavobacterium sp. F-65]MCC9071850.1 NRDE family protein [Flavobacterium sp. F-65]
MCTVTFVNSNGKIILTSNRDEKVIRPSAIPPKNYIRKGRHITFPKDSKAGGTWYALDDKGTVLVLLNGASIKHEVILPYRKSRGLIVLDIIEQESPKDFWDVINLENIEPFTLVLYQKNRLFQLRWDGILKETIELSPDESHIWSSVTLYSEEIREKRANWFRSFLTGKSEISSSEMLDFHRYTEKDNTENGLVINRDNELKTLSITQTVIEKNKVMLGYYDLILNLDYLTSFITI